VKASGGIVSIVRTGRHLQARSSNSSIADCRVPGLRFLA
jgi:hypothetical protein